MKKGDEPVPVIGQLIRVPLRNRLVLGFVVDYSYEKPEFNVRPVSDPVQPELILTNQQFEIAQWMCRETASSLYQCASLFLPPGRLWKAVDVYTLNPDAELESLEFTAAQQQVIDELRMEEEVSLPVLRSRTGKKLSGVLPDLVKMGAIQRWQRPENRVPRPRMVRLVRLLDADVAIPATATRQREVMDAIVELHKWRRSEGDDLIPLEDLQAQTEVATANLDALVKKGAIDVIEMPAREAPEARSSVVPNLSPAQTNAWKAIETALQEGDSTPNLLFGVTGSGKTEIYLRAVAWCLRHKRTAMILVPEIALATQVVRRFIDRFPGRVDVFHSRMTDSQRYDLWRRVAAGEVDVVVGPRSALFVPLENLGLIVIDEEHDSSFKQDIDPRYHARDVAVKLAAMTNSVVVMGSATPAVESTWRARNGEYRLLELPGRVSPTMTNDDPVQLPEVRIVDLRAELRAGNADLLSRELQTEIERSLHADEQSIVLLNRRGMSTAVICRDQGHRIECPNCDIPMVFHADLKLMICHCFSSAKARSTGSGSTATGYRTRSSKKRSLMESL